MSSFLLLQQCSVCLVCLIYMRLEIAAVLWDVASRICSICLVAFLCSSDLAFSL